MFDHGHGMTDAVADPGGGGSRGSGPPLLGHDVGFLTLGPKLGPPFFACRPKMDPPPPFKNPGSAPADEVMDECSWDGCKVHPYGMDDLKVHGTTGKFMGSWMKSSWDDF